MFPAFLLRVPILAAGFCLALPFSAWAETGPFIVEPMPPVPASVVAMNHKLETLVLPRVDLRDKSLSDAIEYLRSEAARVDGGPAEGRGIGIFLKLPNARPDEAAATPVPITLTLEHPTLMEALRAVAAKEGMKVRVEQYAIAIVPLGEQTDPLFTASVQVSPELLNQTLRPADAREVDLRGWLTQKGMTFPPGSSAAYVTNSSKLIVRNTEANIAVLKKIFESPGTNRR